VIVGDTFLWLHLPKTGGTTMNRLFRALDLPGVVVDPDDTPAKHDSVAQREGRGPWRAGDRVRLITARRLGDWLISDFHNKRRMDGLADLPLAGVRSGRIWSVRLGGVWIAADWWLEHLAIDEVTQALRLEHLADDMDRYLRPLLPPDTPAFRPLPREHADPGPRDPRFTLRPEDLARIHAANPRWSAWERQVYGDAATGG